MGGQKVGWSGVVQSGGWGGGGGGAETDRVKCHINLHIE